MLLAVFSGDQVIRQDFHTDVSFDIIEFQIPIFIPFLKAVSTLECAPGMWSSLRFCEYGYPWA